MELEGRVKEIPVLHGKDLIEQQKESSLIKKLFLCVGQGLTTGKWEFKWEWKI